MIEWQPIETAPKDSRILGWDGTEIVTLDWEQPAKIGINNHIDIPGSWIQISDSGRATAFSPTHWMPLPEPPELTTD